MTVTAKPLAVRVSRAKARHRLLFTTALLGGLLASPHAWSQVLPNVATDGGAVISIDPGDANRMIVDLNGSNRIIEWNSFNLGTASSSAESINFRDGIDVSTARSVLNRVNAGNPSSIYGQIDSTDNITVWLVNPSGITFGPTGGFSGGSLVLSTLDYMEPDFVATAEGSARLSGSSAASIALVAGSGAINARGSIVAVGQRIESGKALTSSDGSVALVAATDVTFPSGVDSPLGFTIAAGTTVGTAKIDVTGNIKGGSIRIAGASSSGIASLLNVDANARLEATAIGGSIVIATASDAANGIAITPGSGADDIILSGELDASAAGDVTITGSGGVTVENTVSAAGNYAVTGESIVLGKTASSIGQSAAGAVNILATNGTIAGSGTLSLTANSLGSSGQALTLDAGTNAIAFAPETTLTGGTAISRSDIVLRGSSIALGDVTGNALHSIANPTKLVTTGLVTLGDVTLAGSLDVETAAGTITVGKVTVSGAGEGLVLNAGGAGSDILANDILSADGDVTLIAQANVRALSLVSATGNVSVTATDGDVTGLAGGTGGILGGYGRADLTASAVGKTVTVRALSGSAQLGTVQAGVSGTTMAGDQIDVQAEAVDITTATARNGGLLVKASNGALYLGSGDAATTAMLDKQGITDELRVTDHLTSGDTATITSKTNARLKTITSTTGNVSVTATDGDVTGLAGGTGGILGSYGRADLTASATDKTVIVRALSGTAQLGTVQAGTTGTTMAGDQIDVQAEAVDITTATARNGGLLLRASNGALYLGSGDAATTAMLDKQGITDELRVADHLTSGDTATITSKTNTRLKTVASTAGNISVTATDGDVTGLAGGTGGIVGGYGRAGLTASAAGRTVTVRALSGSAQLGTVQAGAGGTSTAGDQIDVQAWAVDVASAWALNGGLLLRAGGDALYLGGGDAATTAVLDKQGAADELWVTDHLTSGDATTITSQTDARLKTITSTAGTISVTATDGDVTGLAGDPGGMLTGYGRANLAASTAGKTVTVRALSGSAQLGTVQAGVVGTTMAGDQIDVQAKSIDIATATARNGGLLLNASDAALYLGTGNAATTAALDKQGITDELRVTTQLTAGGDVSVTSKTNARLKTITSDTGNVGVTATDGDVTGLAGDPGGMLTGYGRANLAASTAGKTVTVRALSGSAQLGTVQAGVAGTTMAGDQIDVQAKAIDIATATARNGGLSLKASDAALYLGAGNAATTAELDKQGITDELRVTTQLTAGGDVSVTSKTNARLKTITSTTGNVGVTATDGDVTGLAGDPGGILAGYGRADLAAAGLNRTVTVQALSGSAQLGTVQAGVAGSTMAGDQIDVQAGAVDITTATARNGGLLVKAGGDALYLGSGDVATTATLDKLGVTGELRVTDHLTSGADAIVTSSTDVRLRAATSTAGNVSVTATDGDVTGVAGGVGGVVGGYGRADLTASATDKTVTVRALSGSAQLGTVQAGAGGGTMGGDQIDVQAGAVDIASASALNGGLLVRASSGALYLGSGDAATTAVLGKLGANDELRVTDHLIAGEGATITSKTHARLKTVTSTAGNLGVTATDGDVTGLAGGTGGIVGGYGRADLAASGAGKTVTVRALSGSAQLGTVQAGAAGTTTAGDQVDVQARAIDIATATARNGGLSLKASTGALYLGSGDAATTAVLDKLGDADELRVTTQLAANGDATITSKTHARLKSVTSATGLVKATATDGDVTGLAGEPGGIVAGYGRADLAASGAGKTVTVRALSGSAQLGTVQAGVAGTTMAGDQIDVQARAVDIATANARNGGLLLKASTGALYLGSGDAATTAVLDKQGVAEELRVTDHLTAGGSATITSKTHARLKVVTSAGGNIGVTAEGDVTGLAGETGGIVAGYGRANLNANALNRTVTVRALSGSAQLGLVQAGVAGTTTAGDQIDVQARAIDIATATARNGGLSLKASTGALYLGSGDAATTAVLDKLGSTDELRVVDHLVAGGNATVTSKTSARLKTVTSTGGNLSVTATDGDVTGLAGGTGGIVGGYGRADLAANGAGKTVTVRALSGSAQLGTVQAGAAGTTTAGDQVDVQARAIDIATATARNGGLSLKASTGALYLGSGDAATTAVLDKLGDADELRVTTQLAANGDATITSKTHARLKSVTSATGLVKATATDGDVTGLAGEPGGIVAGYGRADLAASGAGKTVTVRALSGSAQLGTVQAGVAGTTTAGDQIDVQARAVDIATATARNGGLLVKASAGQLTLGTGTANVDANLAKTGTTGTLSITGGLTAATGGIALSSTADVNIGGAVVASTAGKTITLTNASTANTTVIGDGIAAASGQFAIGEAELNRLQASNVVIDSLGNPVAFGKAAIADGTGATALRFYTVGAVTLGGAILAGGTRTLQIGGVDAAAPNPDGAVVPGSLATSIFADATGASITIANGTLDLRARKILFGNAALKTEVDGLSADGVAQLVANSGSSLYHGNNSGTTFLTAKQLRVSYADHALFQNTNASTGGGVSLNQVTPPSASAGLALQLFSGGDGTSNSFALFGQINGFSQRSAGILPEAVLNFSSGSGGSRFVRITQSNSRVNGCVIGSPDKGCLIIDTPPPNFTLFDERQTQLFTAPDNSTIAYSPLVGRSNEGLITGIGAAELGSGTAQCQPGGERPCSNGGLK